jgi:hypothetical protein
MEILRRAAILQDSPRELFDDEEEAVLAKTQKRAPKADSGSWKPAFIASLRHIPVVRRACYASGVSRRYCYKVKKRDPVFAKQWDEAMELGIEHLEERSHERALTMSDTLATFLLKAHKPKLYRETIRQEVTGPNGGPVVYKDAKDKLVSKLLDGAARRQAAGSRSKPQ